MRTCAIGLWLLLICLALPLHPSMAGESRRQRNPELLTNTPLPPPKANPNSNINPQPDAVAEKPEPTPPPRRRFSFGSKRNRSEEKADERKESVDKDVAGTGNDERTSAIADENAQPSPEAESVQTADGMSGAPAADAPQRPQYYELPTPEGVELYRQKLEGRLLERYDNHPEYSGRVAKVSVVLSKPLDVSLDGKLIRAEFDQLVYDSWGKRLPDLEKEYFVVTFGSGGAAQVRSDPSVRIGLDLEKTYSERAPLAADPFRNVPESEAFRPTPPEVRMPNWWRPEFPELN